MNKRDLTKRTAAAMGGKYSAAEIAVVLNSILLYIQAALMAGERVTLNGFGKFEVRKRAARQARNPRTVEVIEAPAHRAPAFKPSKKLKAALNL